MDDKYIYHSGGHLTSIYGSVQKGRTEIILAAQSAKYQNESGDKSRNIPYMDEKLYLKKNNISYIKSYNDELIRDTFFNETAHNYFDNIDFNSNNKEETIVYTPAEDAIRFYDIDYIVTEFLSFPIEKIIKKDKPKHNIGPKAVSEEFISASEHMGKYIAPYFEEKWFSDFKSESK